MQKRHTDRESYFDEQSQTSKNYYIPYIKEVIGHIPDKVLEVGCGEGGNLLPFAEAGCRVMGVDIDATRIEQARTFFAQKASAGTVHCHRHFPAQGQGYEFSPDSSTRCDRAYQRQRTVPLRPTKHLSADGAIFVGFSRLANAIRRPPADSTQPHCFHISLFSTSFPRTLYRWILRLCGEQERVITELLDIKSTGCTIELFNRIARQANYQIIDRRLYLINPHYKIKFGLSPRRLNGVIAAIPYIRNFFCTSCFYILKKGTKTVNHY